MTTASETTIASGTKAERTPIGAPIAWILIQARDGSQLWFHDRDTTHVAAIEGGWLFRFRHYEGERSPMSTQALTFVPDPEHRWQPAQTKPRWERLGGVVNAAYNDQTARMPVAGGWVYLTSFATRGRDLTLALVFVPV